MGTATVGRPREYCRRACRQRAYEARRRAADLDLGADELIVTRNELHDARDRIAEILDVVDEARASIDDGIAADRILQRLLTGIDTSIGQN